MEPLLEQEQLLQMMEMSTRARTTQRLLHRHRPLLLPPLQMEALLLLPSVRRIWPP